MATIPVYRYRTAPDGLMTRRQLRAHGLRPGGHDPVAEIRWASRKARHTGGQRFALLYDPAHARPVRPMTPGRWRSHHTMMRARRTCPTCRRDAGYVIPTSLGTCVPCAT
ncbi:RRQRL motif-containing zinc-binding protein [Actinacidiphila sp. ITFR-21]|uniref:RRQRL motif-containing zinc-binding protein n=1 Tax=Actinacidiphila sp. ITFR-21 TaxID=3075199 RepID=UPI00288B1D3A|nr:RRQRL motif-containing zinc-binding protein [Streptomyces sp. ITFR-21]WNI16229.1 RRQRL motif-containing zinc-binding protein [Streptomyces sp. ITFR-21]